MKIYNTKQNFPSSFLFFFFLINFILKGKAKIIYHETHECYAMQILKAQKRTKHQKKNGHKEYWDEAQGSCQKDSIRLSLLHPKLFRCNSGIGVIIHIRMTSNSRIGIKF